MRYCFSLFLLFLSMTLLSSCKVGGEKKLKTPAGGSSGSYERTRWPLSAFPLQVHLANKIDEDYYQADGSSIDMLQDLLDQWDSEVSGITLFKTPTFIANKVSSTPLAYKDSVMGIYLIDDWFSNITTDALAITQWFGHAASDSRGDYAQMFHADIMLNNDTYNFKSDPNSSPHDYFIEQVILHELGHLLGLDHVSVSFAEDAVMKAYMGTAETLNTLQPADKDSIYDLYSNISALTPSEAKQALAKGKKSAGNSPSGKIIRGIIELRANGECVHKVEDQVVYRHQLKSDLKKYRRQAL